MIYGIGTDIVDVRRFQKWPIQSDFWKLFLTLEEREYLITPLLENKQDPRSPLIENFYPRVAGIFSCKEAFYKALKLGISSRFGLLDLQHHKVELIFSFQTNLLAYLKKLNITHVHSSISHEKNYATATVILESCPHNLNNLSEKKQRPSRQGDLFETL